MKLRSISTEQTFVLSGERGREKDRKKRRETELITGYMYDGVAAENLKVQAKRYFHRSVCLYCKLGRVFFLKWKFFFSNIYAMNYITKVPCGMRY